MKKFAAFLMMLTLVASFSVFAQEAPEAPEAPETPAVEAEESSAWIPSLELSATWGSKYMCDGKVVNPNAMTFLDAFMTLNGFYVDLWAAMDMSHWNRPDGGSYAYKNDRQYRAEEVDYVIGYAYTFEDLLPISPLTIDVAYKYFQYPRAYFDHDEPLDMTIYLDNLLGEESKYTLGTGVTFRYDLNWYTWYGWYDVTLGTSITDKLSAKVSAKVFWGTKNKMRQAYGLNRDVISSLEVKGDLSYQVCENITLGAFVDCGWALDHEIRQAWKDDSINNEEHFRFGMSLAYAF